MLPGDRLFGEGLPKVSLDTRELQAIHEAHLFQAVTVSGVRDHDPYRDLFGPPGSAPYFTKTLTGQGTSIHGLGFNLPLQCG